MSDNHISTNPSENDPSELLDDDFEQPKSPIREIFEWVSYVVVGVIVALLVNQFILINARIPSGSMESTIMTGDRVFGLRLAYAFGDPNRGDIIIFKFPDDPSENFIKRIIGLPGETLEIRDGLVYINGSETPLDESYLNETPDALDFGPYEIPEDSYFVMGDNRNHSNDARFWDNTYVTRDAILAKAGLRYWPLNKIGIVK